MKRRIWFALAASGLACVAPVLATAKPVEASVDAVYERSRCTSSPCESGNPALQREAIVTKTVEIAVSARTGFAGLDRVRLEALPPDKRAQAQAESSWVCLEDWFAERALEFSQRYVWDTAVWPDPPVNSQCPEAATHFHKGLPTLNGDYLFRVRAWDVEDNAQPTVSQAFPIRLANAPATPVWQRVPRATGDATVSLQWKPNREADIAEYRFVRVAPDGTADEFAVDAHNPGAQGCSKVLALYYACSDRGFGGKRSGPYRYAIVALRPAPGAKHRCALSPASCAESPLSTARAVTVRVPPAQAASVATPAANATVRGARATPAPSALASVEAERHEALLSATAMESAPSRLVPRLVAALVFAAAALAFALGRRKVLAIAPTNGDAS